MPEDDPVSFEFDRRLRVPKERCPEKADLGSAGRRTPSSRGVRSVHPLREPKVAIVVPYWNSYRETIRCLDSLLSITGVDHSIILAENGSESGLTGQVRSHIAERKLCGAVLEVGHEYPGPLPEAGLPRIVQFRIRKNRGYASGCNLALRYALKDPSFTHFWILDNDTEVEPDVLSAVIARMAEDPSIGICGFRLMEFEARDVLQAAGGGEFFYDRATSGVCLTDADDADSVEARLDFIHGASMICTRAFLEEVGLIEERYFLYFEEIDWALRARKLGYRLGYAPKAIVYHKGGATIGSSVKHRPSDLSLRYMTRNRLIFTRLARPDKYWTVVRRLLFEACVHFKRLDFRAARITLHACAHDMLHRPSVTRNLR